MIECRAYFDQIADSYDASDSSELSALWRDYDLSNIQRDLPEDRFLFVDAGCGNGFYTRSLARMFERTCAIDVSMRMLVNARTRIDTEGSPARNVSFVLADVVSLDRVLNAQASFILASGSSLCYSPFWEGCGALYRALKPGGRVWLHCWNKTGSLVGSSGDTRLRELSRIIIAGDLSALVKFCETGLSVERSYGHHVDMISLDPLEAIEGFARIGYITVNYFGRKILRAILGESLAAELCINDSQRFFQAEASLARLPSLAQIAPSTIYVLERSKQ